jgi:hypothetical protein
LKDNRVGEQAPLFIDTTLVTKYFYQGVKMKEPATLSKKDAPVPE